MSVKYSAFVASLVAAAELAGTDQVVVVRSGVPMKVNAALLEGTDGREIELRKGSTAIEWRYTGETVWNTLVALADLKGDPGSGLSARGNWVAQTYNPGDYVTHGSSLWILTDSASYASVLPPPDDLEHWMEWPSPPGVNGKDAEMRIADYSFQWRLVGDEEWKILGPTNQFPTWVNKGTTSSAGVVTLDLGEGESQRVQVIAAITMAFANWPTSGKLASVLIELVNGGLFDVAWPEINWIKPDGTTTTSFAALGQPLQASGTDWLLVWTRNAGATVWGKVIR